MSITQQKSDLRAIIHRMMERYIDENPEQTRAIALAAVNRLSGKMTLKELREWHTALSIEAMVDEHKELAR